MEAVVRLAGGVAQAFNNLMTTVLGLSESMLGRMKPGKAVKLQREKLILQLADAALAEEGPLPGADNEYQTARKAEAALAEIRLE